MTVALSAVLLAGCSSGGGSSHQAASVSPTSAGTYRGQSFTTPRPRPSFTLTDTQGARYDFGTQTRGHPTLLYFGYTNCPDICPTTMASFGVALEQVPAAVRTDTRVVFVTTDPTRDTPKVIGRWLSHFDQELQVKFIGLTGTKAQVEAAQRLAGVPLATDDGQQHSAEVLLYGADDLDRIFYTSGVSPVDISHDLPIVGKQKE
ncbi:MAG TPA: SCO family protein [Mycobacteriales bacterium]|nr:SCO family protein [Mycobacteriales bacterium]